MENKIWLLLLLCLLVNIVCADAPVASFTTITPTGDYPEFLVKFTDTSTNTPTGWNWTFTNVTGNNTPVLFSSIQNPFIIFEGNGNYSIQLNCSNIDGNARTNPLFYNLSDDYGGTSHRWRGYTKYDGAIGNNSAGTWAKIRNATSGNIIWETMYYNPSQITASSSSGIYTDIYKTYTTFDTSIIPASATITNVNVTYWGAAKNNGIGTPNLSLIDAEPSYPSQYISRDWSKTSYLRQANDIPYANWAVNRRNTFTDVNSSYITKGGSSVFGTSLNWLVDNQEPTGPSGQGAYMYSCGKNATSDQTCYGNLAYIDIVYDSTPVFSPPTARYSVYYPDGFFPDMKLTFTDTSTNASTSWTWDARNVTGNNTPFTFATSAEANITLGVGNWSIQHTATNADGSDTTAPAFFNLSECFGTTCTHRFYPSLYGGIGNETIGTWRVKHEATTGNSLWGQGTVWYLPIPMPSTSTEGVYGHWSRVLLTFPTSMLTNSVVVTDATVRMWGAGKQNTFTSPNATILDAYPSDPTHYTTSDWNKTTFTRLSADVAYADFDTTPGRVNFVLNNNSYINKTGYTSFYFMNNFITDNIEPSPWVNSAYAYLLYCDANYPLPSGCQGLDNVLEITYSRNPETPPLASFTSNISTGTAPLTVAFTDKSTNTPATWNWSFGDNEWFNTTDIAAANPVHTYTTAGTYTVSLMVENNGGGSSHVESDYITVTSPVAASSKICIFRGLGNGAGVFYLRESPLVTTPVYFGMASDTPLVGDWTGTGTDSVGVFRGLGNGAGVFYLRESPTKTSTIYYGVSTDTPLSGDWTGTGTDSVGVFRGLGNGAGVFYLRESPTVTTPVYFGMSSDTPFVWNDNGISKIGVFRGLGNGAGVFYLRESPTKTSTIYYGVSTDTPLIGDWTGTGTDSVGVFRGLGNGAGVFYLRESPTVTNTTYFGLSTDSPIAGKWN